MSGFNKYRRTQIAEMRPVNSRDIEVFVVKRCIPAHVTSDNTIEVSISDVDAKNGSPRFGDMIARNPKNHLDQWLVAEQYFKDNFEIF